MNAGTGRCVVLAAGTGTYDGLPVLLPSLPSCRRRYLVVEVATPPYVGPWRRHCAAVELIVLRGEVRVGGPADQEVVVRVGERAGIAAGAEYRLLAEQAALFELYLPALEPVP